MNNLMTNQETLYTALVNRDSSFEGVFISGVKTTGIFCRSTCSARKPNRENVGYGGGLWRKQFLLEHESSNL